MYIVYEVFKKDGKRFQVFSSEDRFDCEVWVANNFYTWKSVFSGLAHFTIEKK